VATHNSAINKESRPIRFATQNVAGLKTKEHVLERLVAHMIQEKIDLLVLTEIKGWDKTWDNKHLAKYDIRSIVAVKEDQSRGGVAILY
jgi:exonuclease III